MLHSLWNAWTWLPAWARVLSAALAWMGFAEVIALFCAVNMRFDREVDVPREKARDAMVRPLPSARPYRPGLVKR